MFITFLTNLLTLITMLNNKIWFISNKSRTKNFHIKYGNRPGKRILNISHWNCGKGLLDLNIFATKKLSEIQDFIENNYLDVLAVS